MFLTSSILWLLLFPLGFFLLIKGADALIRGATSLAKRFDLSTATIGLTIVAFGTSFPEFMVNIFASAEGIPDLAIGNVFGSNTTNILLALGGAAVLSSITLKKETIWKQIPFQAVAIVIVFLLANDQFINGANASILTRGDGIVLLFFFLLFLYYSFTIAKPTLEDLEAEKIQEAEGIPKMAFQKSILLVMLGIILLPMGAQLVINGAETISTWIGLSEAFIGLTLVAVGTSLPEIVTSVLAAYRKQPDLAVGNVMGSNLFNIFFVLGSSALIRPLAFNPVLNVDILVTAGVTLLLYLFIALRNNGEERWFFFFRRETHVLSRTEGIVLLLVYVGYLSYLIWRG